MAHSGLAMTQTKSVADLRGAGKLVAKEAGGNTVKAYFEANKTTLAALLPRHMTPERMLTLALNCLRTTPKLMDCTLDSLFRAVIVCSQYGLEPNTPSGHVYLIPFENRRKGVTEVQIVLGYKGLIDLARRSGEIETLSARVTYKGDDFSIEYGIEDRIKHKPKIDGEPGEPLGVYAVAKLKGGGYQFEWMSVAQINKIRDGSQGYATAKRSGRDNTPWITNWEEMAKKTVLRRLTKYLPMSIELANAVALDARADAGKEQGIDLVEGEFQVLPEDAPEETMDQETGEVTTKPAQVEHKPAVAMPEAQPERQTAPMETLPEEKPAPRRTKPEPVETLPEPGLDRIAPADDADGFGDPE